MAVNIDPIKLLERALRFLKDKLLKPEERSRDKHIFNLSDMLMSESQLRGWAKELTETTSTYDARLDMARSYIEFLKETGNQYHDEKLKLNAKKLVAALNMLLIFIDRHFDDEGMLRDDQYIVPEVQDEEIIGDSISEKESTSQEVMGMVLAEELYKKVGGIEKTYSVYRSSVSRALKI